MPLGGNWVAMTDRRSETIAELQLFLSGKSARIKISHKHDAFFIHINSFLCLSHSGPIP
jgi:hypothetical protein